MILKVAILENQILDFDLIHETLENISVALKGGEELALEPKALTDSFSHQLSLIKISLDHRYGAAAGIKARNHLVEAIREVDAIVVDHRLLGYSLIANPKQCGVSLIEKLIEKDPDIAMKQIVFLSRSDPGSKPVGVALRRLEDRLDSLTNSRKYEWVFKNWREEERAIGNHDYFQKQMTPIFKKYAQEMSTDNDATTLLGLMNEIKGKIERRLESCKTRNRQYWRTIDTTIRSYYQRSSTDKALNKIHLTQCHEIIESTDANSENVSQISQNISDLLS